MTIGNCTNYLCKLLARRWRSQLFYFFIHYLKTEKKMENENQYFFDQWEKARGQLPDHAENNILEFLLVYEFLKADFEMKLTRDLATDEVLKLMAIAASVFNSQTLIENQDKQNEYLDKLREELRDICTTIDSR